MQIIKACIMGAWLLRKQQKANFSDQILLLQVTNLKHDEQGKKPLWQTSE